MRTNSRQLTRSGHGPVPDVEAAARFLTLLDEGAKGWTFQTFDDDRGRKAPHLTRLLHGTLEAHVETLADLNRRGAGVFVTVNETDLQGRRRENIVRIRTVWQEDDGGGEELPLEPHLVVETSPGKHHRYLLADGLSADEHRAVQEVLVERYGSDAGAKDIARVLRLPGFYHGKGAPHLVRIVRESLARPYSRDELLGVFPAARKTRPLRAAAGDEPVLEGRRNTFLVSLAGAMRRRGMGQPAIAAALAAENEARCQPPLEAKEVAGIARSVVRYPTGDGATGAQDVLERTVEATAAGDAGAPFEPEALVALRQLRAQQPAAYFRIRHRLKAANSGVPLPALDRTVQVAGEDDPEPGPVADQLVALVRERAALFHDTDGTVYASFREGDHRETWALDSRGFREWLCAAFYREAGRVPREAPLRDAIGALAGIARFEGEERKVSLRVAEENGRYYLDLGNTDWQAVEITAVGWQVLDHPPVHFRRTATMRPLPLPDRGGDLASLWATLNVADPDRPLLLAWLLECWRPETHTPVLELGGEQGSGKSETQARLRDLVDPNEVNLRAAPVRIDDLFVGAHNNWLVSFNNLSRLTASQQDALCVLATGGGFASRTLFSNDAETAYDTRRPVVMNGIGGLATAQDLVDRVVHLELPPLATRRPSSELAAGFEAARAPILGALLDLFVATLRELPGVRLDELPRMADFARLGEAMARALGAPGGFAPLYRARREAATLAALESSPVAGAVLDLMETCREWTGLVKSLLEVLAHHRQETEAWPRSARGLATALRRAAPALRLLGIQVTFDPHRRKDGYHVALAQRIDAPGADDKTHLGEYLQAALQVHHVHQVHQSSGANPQNLAPNRPSGVLGVHGVLVTEVEISTGIASGAPTSAPAAGRTHDGEPPTGGQARLPRPAPAPIPREPELPSAAPAIPRERDLSTGAPAAPVAGGGEVGAGRGTGGTS